MLKQLMISTAIGGLMVGAAVAQTTPPTDSPAQPPAAKSMPADPPASTSTPPGSGSSTMPPAATGDRPGGASGMPDSAASSQPSEPRVVNAQQPDQWLASSFRGMDVVGADDEKIGDVSDILFNRDGSIEAYIVSIGGFLGLGAKDVAMSPDSFEVIAGKDASDSDQLKLPMTKDQLEKVATFEPHREKRTTTGSGAPATGSKAPGGAPAGR